LGVVAGSFSPSPSCEQQSCPIKAALDEGVPAPVLTMADFQGKLLSAMSCRFGGHLEKFTK
jgi:6-phosphogluconate dehydrogenase (decarboxylating)